MRAWKLPRLKSAYLIIKMHLKCNPRTTFCRKPWLQKGSERRFLADLTKTPKYAIFCDYSKGKQNENRLKKADFEGLKNTSAQFGLSPNYYALKVQSSDNFLAQNRGSKGACSAEF